jgi:L-alanine-DL-glutamate epimerase-like enolase superfamily enzyme
VIADLSWIRVRVPFRAPFRTAAGTWTARDSRLLRVTAADGRIGWGETVLEAEEAAPVLEALLDELLMTGLPPAPALVSRAGAAGRAFRAAFDGAWLDVLGQTAVARTGADRPPSVAVNAVIGAMDADAAAEEAEQAMAAGFGTLKLKTAPDDTPASLVERVGAVRAAVSDAVELRLDANGTWDLQTAERRLRTLAGFRLQYVEQPLAPGDLAGAVRLRAAAGTPVAADEAVDSPEAARAVLDAGAADVLVVKLSRVGGPQVAGDIALAAAERGVPVVLSSLFETGVGLAAAVACAAAMPDVPGWPAATRAHGLATAGLLEDDLLVEPLVIEGGRMRAPGGPGSGGLGITVDEAAIARYRVGGE